MKKIAMIATTVALSSLVAHTADAKVHTVKEGESLWTIAEKYNTTITKIQKINKLDSELILPNQKLEVLVNGKYKVQKGDTLAEIAKKFDVKVSQIKKLNHIKSDDDLKVGKAIKIERAAKNVETVATAPVTSTTAPVKPVQQKAAVSQTSYKVANVEPKTVEAQTVETKTQAPVQQKPVQQTQPAQPVQQTAVKTTSSASPATNSSMDAHLKLIAQRESGGNPSAVNPAGYYGLFQFSPSTWAAVGGTGNPANASVDEQWKRARILYETAGASQWSTAY